MRNFKDNPHYVTETKQTKSLWGDEKPLTLDELTINLIPDEEKTQQKTVWDAKKKKFIKGNVDKNGQLIRKNEAGVIIKKNRQKSPRI